MNIIAVIVLKVRLADSFVQTVVLNVQKKTAKKEKTANIIVTTV